MLDLALLYNLLKYLYFKNKILKAVDENNNDVDENVFKL